MSAGVRSPKRAHTVGFLASVLENGGFSAGGVEYSDEETRAELWAKRERKAGKVAAATLRAAPVMPPAGPAPFLAGDSVAAAFNWLSAIGAELVRERKEYTRAKLKRRALNWILCH